MVSSYELRWGMVLRRWLRPLALVIASACFMLSGAEAHGQTPSQYPVTGNLSSIAGTSSDLLQVRLALVNCGGGTPVVTGTTLPIASTATLTANSSGTVSGAIWGNDAITCNSVASSLYQVTYLRNNVPTGNPFYLRITSATDLTTATPVTVLPPTGMLAAGITCPTAGDFLLGIMANFQPICGPPVATVRIGSVTTLSAGSQATVNNSGTEDSLILNFGIPQGQTGGVAGVSNSDGTLSVTPTTGSVTASLNTAHSNSWTAIQTFSSITGIGTILTASSSGTTNTLSAAGKYWISANLTGPAAGYLFDITGNDVEINCANGVKLTNGGGGIVHIDKTMRATIRGCIMDENNVASSTGVFVDGSWYAKLDHINFVKADTPASTYDLKVLSAGNCGAGGNGTFCGSFEDTYQDSTLESVNLSGVSTQTVTTQHFKADDIGYVVASWATAGIDFTGGSMTPPGTTDTFNLSNVNGWLVEGMDIAENTSSNVYDCVVSCNGFTSVGNLLNIGSGVYRAGAGWSGSNAFLDAGAPVYFGSFPSSTYQNTGWNTQAGEGITQSGGDYELYENCKPINSTQCNLADTSQGGMVIEIQPTQILLMSATAGSNPRTETVNATFPNTSNFNAGNTAAQSCGTASFTSSTTSAALACGWVTTSSHCAASWIGTGVAGGALGYTATAGSITLTAETAVTGFASVLCSAN